LRFFVESRIGFAKRVLEIPVLIGKGSAARICLSDDIEELLEMDGRFVNPRHAPKIVLVLVVVLVIETEKWNRLRGSALPLRNMSR